jgi:hypothetical protein
MIAHHHSRSQWTVRTVVPVSAITADAVTARATLTLALAARGLIEIINALGHPWARLVETLLLALLAMGFILAARRSHDHRGGWLLSGAVAIGLATTTAYHFIMTAITAATG